MFTSWILETLSEKGVQLVQFVPQGTNYISLPPNYTEMFLRAHFFALKGTFTYT